MVDQAGTISDEVVVSVHALTDRGRVRTNNEDAVLVLDVTAREQVPTGSTASLTLGKCGVLLAVSDGMGGHNAGEVASAVALETLAGRIADEVANATDEVDVDDALRIAVER